MEPIINKYIESLDLGSIQVFKNMAMVPLFLKDDSGPDYLTLQEALDKKVLKITEVNRYRVNNALLDLKILPRGEDADQTRY